LKTVLRCLDRAGASLMLGLDSDYHYTVPGFSVHDELRLAVEAGLTPGRALETTTVEAARFLGLQDETGTVEAGKTADLLLLEADPLESVANVARRAGVMSGGIWLEETWLRDRLESIAQSYQS
jgi:imidazolonepropionase-like amidohydrolase